MLKIVEAFSGIGSQAKALSNIGVEYEILNTVDWDINAIIAYDLIHNGPIDKKEFGKYTREQLLEKLVKHTLSFDGKKPATKKSIEACSTEFLETLNYAIERSHNLISITDVKGNDLPDDVDLMTYSFPCQDLSTAGYWHKNKSGIDRNAHNRSGMLWEVERILLERFEDNKPLPKMLLMENVSNIINNLNIDNFMDWQNSLEKMGYYNHVVTLNASNFGIPQKRVRTYMLSVHYDDAKQKDLIEKFFKENDLENMKPLTCKKLKEFIKNKYNIKKYREEADDCQASNTLSRKEIYDNNVHIVGDDFKTINDIIVPTVTTKQDRHPNSGVIDYKGKKEDSYYRFLTPRECFLLMGFDEKDYEAVANTKIYISPSRPLFTKAKLYKMAGNSIVVNVLQEIFKQAIYIKDNILEYSYSKQLDDMKRQLAMAAYIDDEDEDEA